MFDWNEQDQLEDTIWAEFNESEDHIVPYPKGTEDNSLLNLGDQKKKNGEAASVVGFTDHASGAQTDFPHLEKQSALETSGQLPASRLDMELWPDLPSLNAALGRNYSNNKDQDTVTSAYLSNFNAIPSLDKVRGNTTVQLDGEPEVFGNDHEERSNSFLDCDWGNIGDFDDFEQLFSNSDSLFGDEMVANGGDFLSTSSDVISGPMQSIPIPHVPLSKEQCSDRGSSLQFNEPSGGNSKQENKVVDVHAKSGEQTKCKSHLTSKNPGKPSQLPEKGDMQKRLARSRKKAEERGKSRGSNNISDVSYSQRQHPNLNMHTLVKAPLQSIQSPGAQHVPLNDGENMGQVDYANQFMFTGFGYPSYPFPTIPLMPSIPAEGNQAKLAAASQKTFTDSSKHSSSLEKPPEMQLRPLMMTRQEKIEKLRRRQQMQAMLAIQQQQQQQLGHQVSGTDTIVPQAYSPRIQNPDSLGSSVVEEATSMELNIPAVQEELHKNSVIADDPLIEEKIYYHLRDALGKLDTRIRLCIRDSLFRLARSATERQSASDRSSTNKSNKDEDEVSENDTASAGKRSSVTTEAETDTNPIDRTVAHLLFHKPCENFMTPTKEEISTPVSLDTDSKVPSNNPRSTSEDQQDVQEMEVQPSL